MIDNVYLNNDALKSNLYIYKYINKYMPEFTLNGDQVTGTNKPLGLTFKKGKRTLEYVHPKWENLGL